MKNFLVAATLGLCLVGTSTQIAFAETELSHRDCLMGDKKDRLVLSARILSQLVKDPATLTPDAELTSLNLVDSTTSIYSQLGKKADDLGCEFTPRARFKTVKDAIYALGNHAMQIKQTKENAPSWLKPGFKAVIAGDDDSKSRIFLTTTPDGFKFYKCEEDPISGTVPHVGTGCDPLMDGTFVVPVEELLNKARGPRHAVLLVLKTVGQFSVAFTSVLGLNLASPVAQTISTMIDPNPLNLVQRDHKISVAIQDLFMLGENNQADLTKDDFILTRRLPFKYADLKQAIQDILQDIDQKEYRELEKYAASVHNPSVKKTTAYKQELEFHNQIVQDYKDGLKAAPQADPKNP